MPTSIPRSTSPVRRALLASAMVGAALLSAPPLGAQLTLTGNYRLYQSDVGGLVEAGDAFGAALAAGDFNGDGYEDLAVGTPGEGVVAIGGAGGVVIAFGSAAGLGDGTPAGQGLHQDVAGVDDLAEVGDAFGSALAVGDFNHDGYSDLAIGVPGEQIGALLRAGAVHVFVGSAIGLVPAPANQFVNGGSFGPGVYAAEANARFGAALVACDRNGDGRDELIIGIPSRVMDPPGAPGALIELLGYASGVTPSGAVYRPSPDNVDEDLFGSALACGNLDQTGHDDLLVGAPRAPHPTLDLASAGAVWRISSSGSVQLRARGGGVSDNAGRSVAVGDFERDGFDLGLWGIPGRDSQFIYRSGGANWDGPPAIGQGWNSLGDLPEPNDNFGDLVAAGDFNRDGYVDGVFGIPEEDLFDGTAQQVLDAGMVQVITSTNNGLAGAGQTFHWGTDFLFQPLTDDQFGAAVAAGDFNKDGIDDLAIGAPGAEWNNAAGTGIVQILLGSKPNWIFGDGFETGKPWKWSSVAP